MSRVIVGREIKFSASHRLPNVPATHKCSRLHGHTYTVSVEVSGPIDAHLGWVVDFGVVDAALREVVYDTLDHRHLNDIVNLENPTSEVLAGWCAERLALSLPHLQIVSVAVREGDGGGWARLARDSC